MNQGKILLFKLSQQRKMHERVEVALQQVLHFQKENPMPPPRKVKLGKHDLINYKCTLESWKSESDLVKSSIERARDLTKGMWNACSNVLDEWGIDEIKESLELLSPKNEVLEQVRVTSVILIQYLAVVVSEVIHFSLISPTQMVTRVNEHAKITKKGIKENSSLIIQGFLHSCLIKGLEVE
jgi:hypothetical protein